MNILITNDDGVYSRGILILKQALQRLGRVIVVAPDRPRSASGHSITLHKPLRVEKVQMQDGDMAYASNGTPSDCISLGVLDVAGDKVDLVVSGINLGPNLGYDLTYSGTVSAAMEGAIMKIPSFAISLATYEQDASYHYAAQFAAHLARILLENKLPEGVLLNVNVPDVPADEVSGILITSQGKRHYAGRIDKRTDPMGRSYYWLGGDLPVDQLDEGTDVKAVADDYISVTPIHLDLTASRFLPTLQTWNIDKFAGDVEPEET